jgi:hypothetical protein
MADSLKQNHINRMQEWLQAHCPVSNCKVLWRHEEDGKNVGHFRVRIILVNTGPSSDEDMIMQWSEKFVRKMDAKKDAARVCLQYLLEKQLYPHDPSLEKQLYPHDPSRLPLAVASIATTGGGGGSASATGPGCRDWDPVLATRAVYVSNGVMLSSTTASPYNDAVVNNPDSNRANHQSGLFDCDAAVDDSIAIARVALPLTSRTRGAGSGSRGSSSGLEQVVLVAELEVKVADVQPTQGFVCLDTFDTPKGKRNVFDVMVEMTLERKPPEWPPMRIARHLDTEGGGALYCIDNRRLFMHKVLCVDSARATARATEVAWMTEFDCKLKQAPPKESDRDRHWRTDEKGIAAAREELNRRLDMAQTLQDVSVGALMRALAAKRDDVLSQYRDEMRSLLTRVDSVNL